MTNPIYSNEVAAREHLEEIRWANGVYCPPCGGFDDIHKLKGGEVERLRRLLAKLLGGDGV